MAVRRDLAVGVEPARLGAHRTSRRSAHSAAGPAAGAARDARARRRPWHESRQKLSNYRNPAAPALPTMPLMNTLAATPAAPLRHDASTIGLVSVAHGLSHFCQLLVPPLFPWIGSEFALSNTQLGLLLTCVLRRLVRRPGAGRLRRSTATARGACCSAALRCLALAALRARGKPELRRRCSRSWRSPASATACSTRSTSRSSTRASARRGSAMRMLRTASRATSAGRSRRCSSSPLPRRRARGAPRWRASALLVAAVFVLLVVCRESLVVKASRSDLRAAAKGGSGFAFLRLPAVWYCFAFFFTFAVALGGIQSFAPAGGGRAARRGGRAGGDLPVDLHVRAAVGMVLGGHLMRDPRRCARVVAVGFGMRRRRRTAARVRPRGPSGGAGAVRRSWVSAPASPGRRATCSSSRRRPKARPGASTASSIRGSTSARRWRRRCSGC